MPNVPEGQLETDVAHHGRHDGVTPKATFRFHLLGAHQHHVVAVQHPSASIDHDGAIAIAVERHSQSTVCLSNDLCKRPWMRRPHTFVDVAAIRVGAKQREIEAELPKERRSDGCHRTVGAIDRDTTRNERKRIRQHRSHVVQIPAKVVGVRDWAGITGRYCPRLIRHYLLDALLEVSAILHSGAGEDLDAVVLIRVVRSGDDDAGVEIERPGEERHGRRRSDTDALDRRTGNARAMSQIPLDPLSRFARVPSNQQSDIRRG